MQFRADVVTSEPCDDEYIAYAFFLSRRALGKHYVMISRFVQPGRESEVFLELDDQSRGTREGIVECKLDEHRLTLTLEQKAAEDIGVAGTPMIVVDFELSLDSLQDLRRTLASIFVNRPEYRDKPEDGESGE